MIFPGPAVLPVSHALPVRMFTSQQRAGIFGVFGCYKKGHFGNKENPIKKAEK